MPTLKQLRYLVTLSEHGHFGRAAEACFVTQSTLSAGIQEIENLLEAPLVDRTKRKVLFTPLGNEIVERARAVLRESESLAEAARANREPLTGVIRLGVIPTISPFLLPKVLPVLRKNYPHLRLYLREDRTARLLDKLMGGDLDVLLIALPYDCGDAETAILFEDRFSIVFHEKHALATLTNISSRRLKSETLLLMEEGHCLRDQALEACRVPGISRTGVFEATSLHTLVQMVDNGLGVTILPQLALDAGILEGTKILVKPLAVKQPMRQIGLVWRRSTNRKDEFELLAQFLRANGRAR